MSESETFDDGGPAFPTYGSATQITGMTLLDYFAGQAMSQMMSVSLATREQCGEIRYETMALRSYAMAVAMLKERERINEVKP